MFADALFNKSGKAGEGDVAQLFDQMEKGLVKNKELLKVINYMKGLRKEDLLKAQLESPEKKLAKLSTTWQRFLIEINRAGFFDIIITALDETIKALKELTPWLRENKDEIKAFAKEVIGVFKWIMANLPLIASYFAALKISGWVLAMQTAAGAAGGLSAALTPLLLRILVIPAAIALATLAFIELYDTMQGQDTLMTRLSEQKDKGLLGYFAAITRTVGEFVRLMTSGLVTGAISMWGHLTGNAQLVEAAKATWAGSVTEFGDRQGKIWGDGRTEGTTPPQDKERVDMWGWLTGKDVGGNKAHVPYPNILYPQTSGANTNGFGGGLNYNPTISVIVDGATAKDGDAIAKAIDDQLKESLNKMSIQAMARTSPYVTPLNFE